MSTLLRPAAVATIGLMFAGSLLAGPQVREKEQRSTHQSFLLDPKLVEKEQETGERQDDAAGRIDWWRQHLGGELSTEFKERLIRELELERAKYPGLFLGDPGSPLLPAAVSGTSWTPIGPTDASKEQNGITYFNVDSGRARTILPVPGDPNTVYFLTSGGGLWKTTNFLSTPPTWTPLTDGIGSTSGGSAAFGGATNVINPNTLYVGFGDPFDQGVGGIIAKTSDGGSTFPAGTKKVLPGVTVICDVKVDISGATEIVLVGTNGGLFRSTDGGANYAKPATLSSGQVWSIVKTSAGWLASVDVVGNTTFYLSTDGGATWSSSTGVSTPSGLGRTTLGVGLPGDAVVYAFATTTNAAAQKDLYRSANGGATWTPTVTNSTTVPLNSNSDQGSNDYMHGQAFYNQMLLVDPTDGTRNTVFVGGNLSTGKSTNGGATWTVLSNWLGQFSLPYAHADFHAAAFYQGAPNRILFGSDGGIFTSTDGGASFDDTKNKGLQTHLIYAMSCGFNGGADKHSVIIGLQDNGTRVRVGSTNVYDQTKGGDGFGVGWSQANNAWTLGSYVFNAIARCTTNPPDDQSKWSTFTTGLNSPLNNTNYYFVTPIIGAPASSDAGSAHPGNNFYTYGSNGGGGGQGKIYSTAPTGTSWSVIGTPGSGGISSGRFVRAESHGIGVSPVDLDHIAAAGNGGVVLISTNATSGSPTWTERTIASLGVATWPGFNSNLAWADNNTLYLCSIDTTAPAAPHVVKSINGGAAWTAANNGLPNVPVVKLAVDPGDATGNTVYAATWIGLYRTVDGGANWAAFGTGQPQGYVSDIYVAPDSSFLRIAFYGRGVYEMVNTPAIIATITSPASPVTLVKGATQYTGNVANFTSSSQLNWTVAAGGGSFSPTNTTNVSPTTVFTAGTTANTFAITGTSQEDGSKTATQNVTVVDPASVVVAVSPTAPTVFTSATQNFTATVTPITNTAVNWTVQSGGGSINASGVYTAPGAAGSAVVRATSVAAPTQFADVTVTIAPLPVSVTISPLSPTVLTSATQQFTATVANTVNTNVTWSVPTGGGSVNATGLYTAPSTPGSAVVRATSVADNTKSADANVSIQAPVTMAITPTEAYVQPNGTTTFTGIPSIGTSLYSVVEGAPGGTITAGGLYTAPATPGDYHVTAFAQVDTTKTATATVHVQVLSVAVTPNATTVQASTTQQFAAVVTGNPNTAVTWSVTEGAAGGTVNSAGLYTAPATPGTYHVKAASAVDGTKFGTATVTVQIAAVLTVSVAPSAVTVAPLANQTFTATVTNGPAGVTWTVLEPGGGSVGASTGIYTAPVAAGTYHVVARSTTDNTKTGQATVTVPPVTISVNPLTATVLTGGTVVINGTISTGAINWTTSIGSLSAATGSSVTFTAGAATGTATVTATSAVDGTKTASAVINVRTRDQNGDTFVDVLDLSYFARYYGTNNAAADLNGDGIVDDLDINIFLTGF